MSTQRERERKRERERERERERALPRKSTSLPPTLQFNFPHNPAFPRGKMVLERERESEGCLKMGKSFFKFYAVKLEI